MQLLYISNFQFHIDGNDLYAHSSYPDFFWQKYLDVFDSIKVLGIEVRNLEITKTVKLNDRRISVEILKENNKPWEFYNDCSIKKQIEKNIKKADAILIKPSRKGFIAIKIAEKHHKKYMIEMTGDIESSLSTHNNFLRRIYAPIIYKKIVKSISNCEFGLYVTSHFLQKKYPIKGLQCGCTDTNLGELDPDVLEKRIEKIRIDKNEYKIGLIGAYSNNGKGIDVAIKSFLFVNELNVSLHILGGGKKRDRDRWLKMNKRINRKELLYFDEPIVNRDLLFKWIDECDLMILPSRSEGLPRSIVEAMSRGCPCITSDVCGLSELIDERWLHPSGDYKKLGKLITKALSNKQYLLQMAVFNFQNAKKYTISEQKKIRNDFLKKFAEKCKEDL